MLITPMTAGYGSGMVNFYTEDEADLINRKLLIKGPDISWFKCGTADPYIETSLTNLKIGDVVKFEFDVMSTTGEYSIYLGNTRYIKKVPVGNTVREVVYIPVIEDAATQFTNLRAAGDLSIFSNIDITCSNKKEYKKRISFKSNSDFVKAIYETRKQSGIYPEGANKKYIYMVEEYGKGNVVVENDTLKITTKATYTYGPAIDIPRIGTNALVVFKIKYKSTNDFGINRWIYDNVATNFLSLPATNDFKTVYKIARIDSTDFMNSLVVSAYNTPANSVIEIDELDFCITTITEGNEFEEREGWGHLVDATSFVEKLDTPYYTLKMQQEGIYEDYVAYREELHEYENSQTSDDTMLLPILQEPVIPESVKAFAEKYKLI